MANLEDRIYMYMVWQIDNFVFWFLDFIAPSHEQARKDLRQMSVDSQHLIGFKLS